MKVVLFCGGLGMRLREYSEAIPKPMVNVGYRPILWHVMKYYAHFGHKDFILCLGWKGDVIKDYFLHYNECVSNDFVLSEGGGTIDLLNSDIHDWRITFVDTGTTSNIGQRLKAARRHVAGEEMFLANYSDGLTDLPLPRMIDFSTEHQAVASFLCVKPKQSFHAVDIDSHGVVHDICGIGESDLWMNGGYFVFRNEIFDYLEEGEELVDEPFHRLIQQQKLRAYRYHGFWGCMDTFKEKQLLDDIDSGGKAPWKVWDSSPQRARNGVVSPGRRPTHGTALAR